MQLPQVSPQNPLPPQVPVSPMWLAVARGLGLAGWASAALAAVLLAIMVVGLVQEWRSDVLIDNAVDAQRRALVAAGSPAAGRQQFIADDLRRRSEAASARQRIKWAGWGMLAALGAMVGAWKLSGYLAGAAPFDIATPRQMHFGRPQTQQMVALVAALAVLAGLAVLIGWRWGGHIASMVVADVPTTRAALGPATMPATRPFNREGFARNWPAWRGPLGDGLVRGEGPWPNDWNGAEGRNIVWKTPLDVPGKSSPIVWDDRIFVTAASEEARMVLCFDARTGRQLWKLEQPAIGQPKVLEDTGYAAATAVTDGQRVYAIFADGLLLAVDFDGKLAWRKNYPITKNLYGHSASLAMHDGLVIVQLDQGDSAEDGLSRLIALDGASGAERWNVKREVGNSWTSPVVVDGVLYTAAHPWLQAYDAATGDEIWRCEGLSGDVAPSPVVADGVAYAAQENANLFAVKLGGRGDVTATHRLWTFGDDLPDIISPLVVGPRVLVIGSTGFTNAVDIKTGKRVWEHEFETASHSSPVLVDGVVHLWMLDGKCVMFRVGEKYEEVGVNELGEAVEASPALAGKRMYIRGEKHLWCIGRKD